MSEDLKEKDINVEVSQEIDPFQEILDYDFSGEKEIDILAKAKIIEDYKTERINVKNNEAENIIDEVGSVYLNEEQKKSIEQIKTNFNSLIKKYDLKETENYTSEQRDAIYGIAQFIKNSFIDKINNLLFTIKFTREEYQILNSFLRNKQEYDGVEIFNILELKTNYLDDWDKTFRSLSKSQKEFSVEIDIKNIVMLYHFISKCKVKGFDNQFDAFINILTKIGDTNRIYNAYNVIKDRVNNDFLAWTDIINVELKTQEELEQQKLDSETK